MAVEKECCTCDFISRFSNTDGEWMDVCTAEDPEDIDEGLWNVCVVDKELFDASQCLNFREKGAKPNEPK